MAPRSANPKTSTKAETAAAGEDDERGEPVPDDRQAVGVDVAVHIPDPTDDTKAVAIEPQADDDEQVTPRSAGRHRYLNVSGSPVRYDKEGHTIGAGEWTPEVALDAIGQDARRREYLLPMSAL